MYENNKPLSNRLSMVTAGPDAAYGQSENSAQRIKTMRADQINGGGSRKSIVELFADRLAFAGFTLYACFAPHSIAGAEISLALVAIAFLIRFFSKQSIR